MDESSSKIALSAFEEEVDNWTFVNSEGHDSTDECSEQESDSGSSIVVIDSQSQQPDHLDKEQNHANGCDASGSSHKEETMTEEKVSGADLAALFYLPAHQTATAEDDKANSALDCRELQQLTIDDPENDLMASSLQQVQEFLRERSPYEIVDPVWDSTDHESESLDGNTSIQNEESSATCIDDEHPDLDDRDESSATQDSDEAMDVAEDEPPTLSLTAAVQGNGVETGADAQFIQSCNEAAVNIDDQDHEKQDEISPCIAKADGKGATSDSASTAEETSAHVECEAYCNTENVKYEEKKDKEDEDWSSDSSDDELDEEAWDLSLEALLNSGSMASSLSSLAQEPISPSPVVPVPTGARIVKPDLLEEANRIEEMDQLDYSAVSNPDLPPELNIANIFRDRHYVHHPNQRLNMTLTYVVAFAMAAVIGFALGHISGLSDNFPSRCSFAGGRVMTEDTHHSNVWTEDKLRSEIQRLMALNDKMNVALKNQLSADSDSCRLDYQVNDLLTENWDLKKWIGRIRYGKPTRSIEDKDKINRLETENQDLRNIVGKLRYQCGQPLSTPSSHVNLDTNDNKELEADAFVSETVLKTLDAMNLTQYWSSLMKDDDEVLDELKVSAADLISLIGLRREELNNLTKENSNRAAEEMQITLQKSVQKVVNLMERIHNYQESAASLASEVESSLKDVRTKLDTRWVKVIEPTDETRKEGSTTSSGSTSLNADWFIAMGQNREKLRHNEQQAQWLFERAKDRERERQNSRKFQSKAKKQKMFQGNSWNQYSA